MSGCQPIGSVESGPYRIHVFQKPGEVVLAAWARRALLAPQELSVQLPAEVHCSDLMGGVVPLVREGATCRLALRSAPCYLSVRGVEPEVLLKRLEQATRQ